MKFKSWIILLFTAIIMFSCNIADPFLGINQILNPNGGTAQIQLPSPVLRTEGDKTSIKIDSSVNISAGGSGSGVTYIWSASAGEINGSGDLVSYRSPDATQDVTIQCYAMKSGYKSSGKTSLVLSITNLDKLTTPSIVPEKSSVQNSEEISIEASGSEGGSTYHWSVTQGSIDATGDASGATIIYTAPAPDFTGTVTISCYATQTNYLDSNTATRNLTVTSQSQLSTPTINIVSGSVNMLVNGTIQFNITNFDSNVTYHWSATGTNVTNANLSTTTVSGTNTAVTFTAPATAANPVITCYASRTLFLDSDNAVKNLKVRLGTLSAPAVSGSHGVLISTALSLSATSGDTATNLKYNWSVASGPGIINPQSIKDQIVVYSSATAAAVVVSCYATADDYYDSTATAHNVTVSLPTPAISINPSNAKLIINGSAALSVSNAADPLFSGCTFHWSITAGDTGSCSLTSATGTSTTFNAGTIAAFSTPVTVSCWATKTGNTDSPTSTVNIQIALGQLTAPTVAWYNKAIVGKTYQITATSPDTSQVYNWSATGSAGIATGTATVTLSDSTAETVNISCYTTKTDYYDSSVTSISVQFLDIPYTSLVCWLDAYDSYTLTTQYESGKYYVSEWDDKSGSDNHVAQSGDFRPEFVTYGFGGSKNALKFDGIDDYMDQISTFIGLNTVPKATFFVVFNYINVNSNYETVFLTTINTTRSIGCWFESSSGSYRIATMGANGTRAFDSTVLYTADTNYLFSSLFDGTQSNNSDRLKLWINGTIQNIIVNGTLQTTTGTVNMLRLGKRESTYGAYYQGYIGEILIFNDELTQTPGGELEKVNAYLAAKWGITLP